MPITSIDQYRQFARSRDEILTRRQRQALLKSFDEITRYARSTEATEGTYNDQTGNLRASTGIDENILAPKPPASLGIHEPIAGEYVHRLTGGWAVFFGIGMEYAKYVAERGPWIERVLVKAEVILERNWDDAMSLAVREIEELAA